LTGQHRRLAPLLVKELDPRLSICSHHQAQPLTSTGISQAEPSEPIFLIAADNLFASISVT